MKRLFVSSVACLVAAVTLLNAPSLAKAEIDGIQIRFKGGCTEENASGRCSIAVRASGFDFTTADRITLYVSAGPNQPMRRISNHWRHLNERGQTIATIKIDFDIKFIAGWFIDIVAKRIKLNCSYG